MARPLTPAPGIKLALHESSLHASPRSARCELLLVSLLSALLLAVAFFTTDRITAGSIWYPMNGFDHHRYIAMATGNLFDFNLAPFCWRILDPMLVRLQPFGVEEGFLAVTLISRWLCGMGV